MFDIYSISDKIKNYFTRRDIFITAILVIAFFITRIINLTQYPIFSDEGIYIHWSKLAWHDPNWRFISLTDGRQPLQTWLTIPFLKLLPNNALLAGRLFGVFSGFFALIGLFLLTNHLFGKKTAYTASILYIITPFFLFFDRIAMVDSFINAAAIWMLYFSILLINSLGLDIALLFGLLSGVFLLAKSSTSLLFAPSLCAPLLVWKKNTKNNLKTIVNYVCLFFIVLVIAFIIYNVQRLSPYLHYVAEKNKTFVLTFDEFIHAPFSVFFYNVRYIPWYVANNLGYTTFILGIIGLVILSKYKKLLAIFLALWVIIPYIPMSFFMRVLSSRYTIFLTIPFILGTAYFFSKISSFKNKYLLVIIIVLGYLFTLYFDYTILFNYAHIPFLSIDRGQYIEGWPAGYGAKEIIQYVREKSSEKPVIILAEGNFGMAGDVLDTFLKPNDNILIKGYWPLGKKELTDNQKDLKDHYIFAVFSHTYSFDNTWPLKLIQTYNKPGNQSALYLFELTNQ